MFYKLFNRSITGSEYLKMTYGPVPRHYDYHYDMNTKIEIQEDDEKKIMLPVENAAIDYLTPEEINVALQVYDYFKNHKSIALSDYSHKEIGWIETEVGQPISYSYAQQMKSIL